MHKTKAKAIKDDLIYGGMANEYIKQCADRLAQQIDFQVMCKIFKESGWTEVMVNVGSEQYQEVWDWVYNDANIKGSSHGFENCWVFERKSDAEWFTLRWSQ